MKTKDMNWKPIETAPKDGTYILLAGPSGYIGTPLRVEVCKYDAEYRPRQPWVNHSDDSFLDGGEAPTHWMELPEAPNVPDQRPPTGDVGLAEGAIGGSLHPVVGPSGLNRPKAQ